MKKEMLEGLSPEEKKELLATLQNEANEEKNNRRQAYEDLRAKFAQDVQARLNDVVTAVRPNTVSCAARARAVSP